MRTYDLTPFYRSTVGFDRFSLLDQATADGSPGYPLQHRRTGENAYRISVAVSGFAQATDRRQGKHADDQGRKERQRERQSQRRSAVPRHRGARFERLPACRLRAVKRLARARPAPCRSRPRSQAKPRGIPIVGRPGAAGDRWLGRQGRRVTQFCFGRYWPRRKRPETVFCASGSVLLPKFKKFTTPCARNVEAIDQKHLCIRMTRKT